MRRLPVYVLIDTSGSMQGEAIQSVNVGMRTMLSSLRQDPYALESVWLSVITFDTEARELFPLTPLERVRLDEIEAPPAGGTFLGAALELLIERVERDVKTASAESKADWRPLLFVMTDGKPSDRNAFLAAAARIQGRSFANVLACGVGPRVKLEDLRLLTDQVVLLETMDAAGFASLFRWVSVSVTLTSSQAGTKAGTDLPPPPPEIRLAF